MTVTPDGAIDLVADLSEGHPVPTGLALDPEGGAYVANLTAIPYPNGAAKVLHISADGAVEEVWTGLTAVTGLALGPDGALYAAELATNTTDAEPFLPPGTGRIVRQTGPDGLEPVVTDILYPVNLRFDPEGTLYLATPAFAAGDGAGQGALLKIDLASGTALSLAGLGELAPSCQGGPGMAAGAAASPVAG